MRKNVYKFERVSTDVLATYVLKNIILKYIYH